AFPRYVPPPGPAGSGTSDRNAESPRYPWYRLQRRSGASRAIPQWNAIRHPPRSRYGYVYRPCAPSEFRIKLEERIERGHQLIANFQLVTAFNHMHRDRRIVTVPEAHTSVSERFHFISR